MEKSMHINESIPITITGIYKREQKTRREKG